MLPPESSSKTAVGALWYKPMLQSATCSAPLPSGFAQGRDALNWAVVVPSSGTYVRLITDGEEVQLATLTAGLNFGSPVGMQAGSQVMQLKKPGNSSVLEVCQGGDDVSGDCGLGFYDFNYRVVGLGSGQSSTTSTTSATQTSRSTGSAATSLTTTASATSHSATTTSGTLLSSRGLGNPSATSSSVALSVEGFGNLTMPTEGMGDQQRVVKWISRCRPNSKP